MCGKLFQIYVWNCAKLPKKKINKINVGNKMFNKKLGLRRRLMMMWLLHLCKKQTNNK